MSQTVTFETAKRLKDAGFPQPELCLNQDWYDQSGKLWRVAKWAESSQNDDLVLIGDYLGDWDIIGKKEQFLGFAPTATDIIREFERLQKSKWIRLGMSGEDWYCYLYAALSGLTDRFPHENPAEACAEAWLKHKE